MAYNLLLLQVPKLRGVIEDPDENALNVFLMTVGLQFFLC